MENLSGTIFADVIRGTDGDNVLHGVGGNDIFDGARETTRLFRSRAAPLPSFDSAGNDTVDYKRVWLRNQSGPLVRTVRGSRSMRRSRRGSLEKSRTPSARPRPIRSPAGANNILIGLGGNDRLLGQSGHDVLIGGDGDDELNGGSDRTSPWAGAGPIGSIPARGRTS